jgi:hypothetical protein
MIYANTESLLAARVAEKFPEFTVADNSLSCLQDHISESHLTQKNHKNLFV